MNRLDGRSEYGYTLVELLGFILLFGSLVYTGLLIIPVYLDYYKVYSSLGDLTEQSVGPINSSKQLAELIKQRFTINQVSYINAEAVSITQDTGSYQVQVAYEVRKHWLGNIDLVMSFHRLVRVSPH
jgi:hypothetical protein